MTGKQVRIFLVDGTPGGLTTAEITNWTGHVLTGPRSELGDVLKREEATRTGVYLLLGDEDDGGVRCYVGEADDVASRLRHHLKNKTFWDRVVLITSKDANLTKAHGRYLESRLITLATQAGRVSLDNGTAPPLPPLPEADRSDMDYFVSQLQIVLPVLGVNAIRVKESAASRGATVDTESPIFRLAQDKLGVNAMAQQLDGEFTMLAGSLVVPVWHGVGKAASTVRSYEGYRSQHQRLVAEGSIDVTDNIGKLTRDVPFSSPSTAGAVALGRSCNGRREWIYEGGTFGQWETRDVE